MVPRQDCQVHHFETVFVLLFSDCINCVVHKKLLNLLKLNLSLFFFVAFILQELQGVHIANCCSAVPSKFPCPPYE